jgi:hypothetical protein
MLRTMHVWPEPPLETNSLFEWRAMIERPSVAKKALWYRMPVNENPGIFDSSDSFAIAAIFPAMRHANLLHIHGSVSPNLLANLEEFQRAWCRWCPDRYRRVDLRAEYEREVPPSNETDAVMTFSGGLDSCFTARQHTKGFLHKSTPPLSAALMVHGFDIPVLDVDVFLRAAENTHKMLASIGLRSLTMATNFRNFGENWEHSHGAALASALHLLKGSYRRGVIASSHSYERLRLPWGSNPLTDPLLSSEHFTIVHHGCGFSRKEKAAFVADWPEAMHFLRVCWEGPQKDRNCGSCLRCVGTAICFAINNASIPTSLQVGDLASAIDRLSETEIHPVPVTRLSELLAEAQEIGIDQPWVIALQTLVNRKHIVQERAMRPKDALQGIAFYLKHKVNSFLKTHKNLRRY